ncbi:MAG: adenine deaminase, partial [Planctomycetota bacterium]
MATIPELKRRIAQALGREKADLAVKGTRFLDVASGAIARGDVAVGGDRIIGTFEEYEGEVEIDGRDLVVVPGFIDTHVHVESTLVTPSEFDRCVLPRGTTTAICDPHEISNVLGLEGLGYFFECAPGLVMDLRVQLSSCVPATHLQTSGARVGAEDLERFRGHPHGIGLAEMMNYPGVLFGDEEVLAKIAAFEDVHVDGHCPLLRGRELNAYAACGIRNCHESTSLEEAAEKLAKGLQVLIREGSVSKDVDALSPLISESTWPFLSFCTDDRNPLDIAEEGHIDHSIRRAIQNGAPALAVYRAATWAAARGFGLRDRGLVAPGYRADLVLLDDLDACAVHAVVKDGRVVGEETFEGRHVVEPVGRGSVHLEPVEASVFAVPGQAGTHSVIGLIPGRILTDHLRQEIRSKDGILQADRERDLLEIAVLCRHEGGHGVGRRFVKGFGLKEGALASSVGHDSHNVIVVGTNHADMAAAVNPLIDLDGAFVAAR